MSRTIALRPADLLPRGIRADRADCERKGETLAGGAEKAPERVMAAELPPMSDWTVELRGVDSGQLLVPWNPACGRVETSGLLFLRSVQERIRGELGRGSEIEEGHAVVCQQALPVAGVLRPIGEPSRHRGVFLTVAMVALVGLALGAGLVLRQGQSGELAAFSAGVGSFKAGSGGPGAAPAVGADLENEPKTHVKVETTAPLVAAAASTEVAAVAHAVPEIKDQDQPSAPLVASGDGDRPESRSERRRRRAREEAREKAEEARRKEKIDALPSVLEALKTVPTTPGASPATPGASPASAAALSTTPGALPVGPADPHATRAPVTADTIQMLRVAAARPAAPAAAPATERLPDTLSSTVLYGRSRAVRQAAQSCLRTFGVTHEVLQLRLEIEGATGKVVRSSVAGRFSDAPVARCVQRAVARVSFPRFWAARQTVLVPIAGR